MSKQWTPGRKKTVELTPPVRPSRIRREPVRIEPEIRRRRRTREEELWLGAAGIVLMGVSCAALALGISNATSEYSAGTAASAAPVQRFQHCYSAGAAAADCVRDGRTAYVGGKKVELAVDSPKISGAACSNERRRGILAATRLRDLLNSGEVAVTGTVRQANGALLQTVAVDGRDIAKAMIAAGVAREYGSGAGWC
jgi:endonuclease YncB( thermonuclease family)